MEPKTWYIVRDGCTFEELKVLLPAMTSLGLMHLTKDGACPSVAISFSSWALNCTVSDVLLDDAPSPAFDCTNDFTILTLLPPSTA